MSVLFADAILIVRCLPRMRFLIVEASALLLDLSTYLNPKCGASGLLLLEFGKLLVDRGNLCTCVVSNLCGVETRI